MITYEEMQYLCAFAKSGTLSEVAERFHISQPSVTRSMKRIEEQFAVPLFDRRKNSIRLNENGILAAQEAEVMLRQYDSMVSRVRAYDRAKHTLSIGSAAAVQIPELIGRLSALFPLLAITTELKKPEALLAGLEGSIYQLIILPFEPQDDRLVSAKIGEEHLMFVLPKNHRFAKEKSLTLGQMNGENMLLFSEIGFWHDIVVGKMPASRFLIQTERYSFVELVQNSVLPFFTTNLSNTYYQTDPSRISVPITDPEVNVSYYLTCKKENRGKFSALFS